MYKSPIEIFYKDIANGIQIKMENDICKAICSYGINVNREELIKALAYDRDQYEKGYSDAKNLYERPQGRWITEDELHCLCYCSECRSNGNRHQPFCGWCGAQMKGNS